jgi:cancer susceptibility candidate protein 1
MFGPIAYLQSKTTDFPYDSWYLRCIEDQVALLSIVTKRINVQIQIHPLYVKLIDMEQPELKHLVNKELHPGILLMELSKCGIHMLPENEDAARAKIHLKDSAAEERAILDIATTLKVFAF